MKKASKRNKIQKTVNILCLEKNKIIANQRDIKPEGETLLLEV